MTLSHCDCNQLIGHSSDCKVYRLENKGPAPVAVDKAFAWATDLDLSNPVRPMIYDECVVSLTNLSTHQLYELAAMLKKLQPCEPFFILRGQDASAPHCIRVWLDRNLNNKGMRPNKILRASAIARAMDQWSTRKEAD